MTTLPLTLMLTMLGTMAASRPTTAPSDEEGSGWKLTWLELDVRLLPEQDRFEVDGLAALRLEAERSTGPTLVLNSDTPIFRFRSVASDGATVEWGSILRAPAAAAALIRFEEPLERGTEIDVDFSYETTGTFGSQTLVRGNIVIASWVEAWTPFPLPSADERYGSYAAGAPGLTRFDLPTGWRSVTNGTLLERREEGDRVVELWEEERRLARSFAAAPYYVAFHELDGRRVGVYRLKENDSAEQQARALSKALVAMEQRFGPFPYASCHLAEVPRNLSDWYAASQQGFIMAQEAAFEFGDNLPLFAHEAAHGWWGNLVNTAGPGSILCSESLAQYGAVIAIETLEGEEALREFLDFSRVGYVANQCARGYFELIRAGQDLPLAELSGQPQAHTLSDAKGHWFYHMLRHTVGDDVFFATLRQVIADFQERRVRLDDVRRAFQAATPDRDLAPWLAQWLDRTGAPILEATFAQQGNKVELAISQRGEPFELDLELDLFVDGVPVTRTIALRGARTTAIFEIDGEVAEVRLDPRKHLLMWRPEYGPQPQLQTDAADTPPAADH